MAKKVKNNAREKHNDDVINELFGQTEEEPDIETDIADLGAAPDEDVKVAQIPLKQKFYFGFAVFVVIMAAIGLFTCIRLSVVGIRGIIENTSLKNEFAQFILPAVANDITPYENEADIPNSVKINCSVWRILLGENFEDYKTETANVYVIPEYNVGVACKELFGTDSEIEHQTVGYGEARFTYDPDNHTYTCPRNLRNLTYAPRIAEMTMTDGNYVLKVEYLPPSISMVTEDLKIEAVPDKIMEYTISRRNKQNTLVSVRFLELVG